MNDARVKTLARRVFFSARSNLFPFIVRRDLVVNENLQIASPSQHVLRPFGHAVGPWERYEYE